MAQAVEMPDFSLAVRNLESLTEQVARCRNLPAVDDGRRLTQALEDMRNGMQEMRNEIRNDMRDMRNEVRAVDRKVEGLDRKVTASNKNFTARIQNSSVIHDKVDLVRLHSVVTGGLIRDCPRTLQELDVLTERQVDGLLTELGEEGRGRPEERKHQLEMALGVVARATRATRRH